MVIGRMDIHQPGDISHREPTWLLDRMEARLPLEKLTRRGDE
jgi:hypothetical protein